MAGRSLLACCWLLSVAVQWLGMAGPLSLVQDWLAANVQPLFAPETFTELALFAAAVAVAVPDAGEHSVCLVARRLAMMRSTGWRSAMPLAGVLAGSGAAGAAGAQPAAVTIETTRCATGSMRRRWRHHPGDADLRPGDVERPADAPRLSAQRIGAGERAGDAILHLRPDQSQSLANSYRGSLPVFGFFNRDADARPGGVAATGCARNMPAVGRPRLPGRRNSRRGSARCARSDFLLVNDRVASESNQRLALFALAPARRLVEAGIGTVFGDPAAATAGDRGQRLVPAGRLCRHGGGTPGDAILLTLLWQSLQPVTGELPGVCPPAG